MAGLNPAHLSLLDVIGNTPAIWLDRWVAHHKLDGRILAKLDYLNPGFSKKDRAAKAIIEAAESSGALQPGQCVIELTSGNMGTGLAIVCALKNYPFVAVMSHGNSPERARMMRALGAEVILVDQAPGAQKGQVSGADLAKVEERAQRLVAERNGFRADKFHHPANRGAHLTTTGPELWQQSGGQLDAFVDFVGSGGTYAGTIQALKAFNPACKGYVVEPDGAAVLSGQGATQPQHPIQGGGYAMKQLAALASSDVDGYLTVTGNDAKQATRGLARLEGVFAGFSAGANLAAAAKLLQRTHKGETIAIIICDSGLKYLSTDLWS